MPDGGAVAEIVITCFENFAARTKTERRLTWETLRQEILTTSRARKEQLPWLKLARFGDDLSLKGSLRHDANLLMITGIEADYDQEILGVDWAVDLLEHAGIKAMVYTSPSHTPAKPRWRVLCPTSRELPPASRRALMSRLVRIFGDIFANESWTLSQAYFYGAVADNADHRAHIVEGISIDLAAHFDSDDEHRDEHAPAGGRQSRHDAQFDEAALLAEITSGNGYHRACVRLLGKWARDGVAYMVARQRLRDAFEQVPEADRTNRWHHRYADIDRCLDDIYGKDAGNRDTAGGTPKSEEHGASATHGWPDPIDFLGDDDLTGLPVLEPEHVPPVLRDFAIDTAERMGVDAVGVVLTGLVACSSVMDEEFRLQPKQHDTTWTEEARLWSATVGGPSVLKTPVIRACTRPIDHLDADGRRQHEQAFADYQRDLKAWEETGKDPNNKPAVPRMPRYLVESTTIEALAEVLRDDPNAKYTAPAKRVLVRQDELGEWVASFDRYRAGGRGGSDRGAYLRLYNGGRHVVDRVGRGSFAIPHWSACIMGGIQPELIQRIAHESADDGLLQRFMYCVPGSSFPGIDRPPNWDAIARYEALFRALTGLHPPMSPDQGDGCDIASRPASIVLHAEAQRHRLAVEALARAMAALPDTSRRLQAAFGKWPGLFARIALAFHLIGIADARARQQKAPQMGVVAVEVAAMAERFMRDILLPHLLRAEAVMFSSVQTSHARWIAGFILARGSARVARRDVVQAYGALRAPEQRKELSAVMESLVTMGWLIPEDASNPARDPSAWLVNPAIHTRFSARAQAERYRRQSAREEVASTLKWKHRGAS